MMTSGPAPSATDTAPAELPNYIASNLRVLRKQHGWSQTELAQRVGLNRGNIASYESGTAEPSICNLLKISHLLGVTSRDITRRDLRREDELALARHAHSAELDSRRERFRDLQQRTTKLARLVEASNTLFTHRADTLDAPCEASQNFILQYRQLAELTEQLLDQQRELFRVVGCQCD